MAEEPVAIKNEMLVAKSDIGRAKIRASFIITSASAVIMYTEINFEVDAIFFPEY